MGANPLEFQFLGANPWSQLAFPIPGRNYPALLQPLCPLRPPEPALAPSQPPVPHREGHQHQPDLQDEVRPLPSWISLEKPVPVEGRKRWIRSLHQCGEILFFLPKIPPPSSPASLREVFGISRGSMAKKGGESFKRSRSGGRRRLLPFTPSSDSFPLLKSQFFQARGCFPCGSEKFFSLKTPKSPDLSPGCGSQHGASPSPAVLSPFQVLFPELARDEREGASGFPERAACGGFSRGKTSRRSFAGQILLRVPV